MSLDQEIAEAQKEIISDGYDMSIGEVMNLYRDNELTINPEYQRLFRWDQTRKTRFIESLLLGIPIPPIFVVQDEKGVWELIDGLQRLSTVLEFSGILKNKAGELIAPSVLEGTTFLPHLAGKRWEPLLEEPDTGIGKAQQLQIKRARLRVEILKKESDPNAKYELFQRLNTGGTRLSPQEVRNCVAVMINQTFHTWLLAKSDDVNFKTCTAQTINSLEQQGGVELALRFFAFRNVPYERGLDLHEYLDAALLRMAKDAAFAFDAESAVFATTFGWLNEVLADNAFKRWNGNAFVGKFLMSAFEVISVGIAANIPALTAMTPQDRNSFIVEKAKALWQNIVFENNSGAGVRGTTRLSNLLSMGPDFFRP